MRFASYAPLLGKIGRTGWDPNLIYFTNTRVAPTINYHVQRLFSTNAGDAYVQTTVTHDDVHTPKPSFGYGTFLGTWGTEAEFDQVRVATGKDVHLQDSFDTSPANWRPDGGAWQVVDGAYRQTFDDARPALSRVATQLPAGDQKLTLRARKTGGAEGFLIGFSMVDSENYYWWNLGGWGNSRHAVEKLTGGAGGEKTIVGKPVDGRIESNRWYDITIERVGRRIRCSLDGSLVHEFEDEGFRPVDVLAVSTVRDTKSGDVILKMVNTAPTPKPVQIELAGGGGAGEDRTATRTVLAGDPLATNGIDAPRPLLPTTSAIRIRGSSAHELPAHSLTVIRINGGGGGDAK